MERAAPPSTDRLVEKVNDFLLLSRMTGCPLLTKGNRSTKCVALLSTGRFSVRGIIPHRTATCNGMQALPSTDGLVEKVNDSLLLSRTTGCPLLTKGTRSTERVAFPSTNGLAARGVIPNHVVSCYCPQVLPHEAAWGKGRVGGRGQARGLH